MQHRWAEQQAWEAAEAAPPSPSSSASCTTAWSPSAARCAPLPPLYAGQQEVLRAAGAGLEDDEVMKAAIDLAESEHQVDVLAAQLEEARQQLEQLERIDHIGMGLAPVPGAAALQMLAQAFAQPADSHAAAAAQYAALLATQRDLRRAREAAAQQEAACAAAERQLLAAVGCLRQAIEELRSAGMAGFVDASRDGPAPRSSPFSSSASNYGSSSKHGLPAAPLQESAVQRSAQYVQQAARQVQTALEGVPELGCLRQSSLDALAGGLLLDLFSGQGLTEAVVQERAWQARLSMSLVKAQLEVAQRWCADNKAAHGRHAAELQEAVHAKRVEAEQFRHQSVMAVLERLAVAGGSCRHREE